MQLMANRSFEKDVTVKLTDAKDKIRYCNGFIVETGSPVYGFSLDPDAEFELEYARPEVKLTLLGYSGNVKSLEAWLSTDKGLRTVLKQCYTEPITVLTDEVLNVVGPAY